LVDLTIYVVAILSYFILYGFVAKAIWTARRRTKHYSRNGQNATKSDSSGVTKVCDQETNLISISVIKVTDKEISTDSTRPTPGLNNSKPLRLRQSYHAERKVSIMMMAVTIGSIASFVPYFIVNLTLKANSKTSEQEFNVGVQIALRSYMLNNAINPYLMGIFNREFRRFVKKLLCRCFNIV
jgi:amino acid transporter